MQIVPFKMAERHGFTCPRCKKWFIKKFKEIVKDVNACNGIKCPRCKYVNKWFVYYTVCEEIPELGKYSGTIPMGPAPTEDE